jgi:hypothetical protein
MSWDIVLFNSKEKIESIEHLNEDKLEPTDFDLVLESSFSNVIKDDNHREIKGNDFSIDFFLDDSPVTNKLISLYGENALFALIELAKEQGWQIYDTGMAGMIDLEHADKNGYTNHRKYVEQIIKNGSRGLS